MPWRWRRVTKLAEARRGQESCLVWCFGKCSSSNLTVGFWRNGKQLHAVESQKWVLERDGFLCPEVERLLGKCAKILIRIWGRGNEDFRPWGGCDIVDDASILATVLKEEHRGFEPNVRLPGCQVSTHHSRYWQLVLPKWYTVSLYIMDSTPYCVCSSRLLVVSVSRAGSAGGGRFGDASVEALLRHSRSLIRTYHNSQSRTIGRSNVPKAFWVSWSSVQEQLSTIAVREMRRRKSRRNILTGITFLVLLCKFAQHSPVRSGYGDFDK
jgi:hypothetical protein